MWIVLGIFIPLCVFLRVSTATNVIFILADDLGYGDLGFAPFNSNDFRGLQTPNLKRLASNGLILTNFHTASPVCSPSRVSILTGIFPWRVGVDFIYSQHKKLDGSEELDHEQLPLLTNIPMVLRQSGLYTAHVGKWHLGGITPINMENRAQGNCSVPGINQYGFDEYVTMTEGVNSARYWTHEQKNTYTKGADYFYKNDRPLPKVSPTPILTDRQTTEAIRIIREQTKKNKSFFLNLWYDAPHSPWEAIEPYYSQYKTIFSSEIQRKYASMISNMDANIGRIMDELESLHIEEDTLIFFTSDNGPEMDVGSPGPYKGRKRLLTEGGIRVPAIVSWKGKIQPSSTTDAFLLTTDLFPTFISALSVTMPTNVRIDGVSFLPVLLDRSKSIQRMGDERVVLWYTHSIGYPKFTAARAFGFKVLWADYEGRKGKSLPPSWRIFDMVNDPLENSNLYQTFQGQCEAASKLSLFPKNEQLSWSDVLRRNIDPHSLGLIRFLEIAMYLFRYEGERSWLTYHDQKPFETNPQCNIRNSITADFLPQFNHLLQPNFCGESLVLEEIPGCVCSFSSCERRWTSNNIHDNIAASLWVENPTYGGVAHYAPIKGTLSAHVHNVLKWTHFTGICPSSTLRPLYDALTRSSLPQVSSIQSRCEDMGSLHSVLYNTSASRGKKKETGFAYGDFVGHQWHRSCHQRVHVDTFSKQFYLTTATCAQDMPIMTVNIAGMPRPAHICPESLERLMSSVPVENFMDDNILLGILNLVLLSVVGAKGEEDIFLRPKPELNTAIIDPLFFHFVGLDDAFSKKRFDNLSVKEVQAHIDKLWGFLRDFETRWDSSCTIDCLEYSIWPWQIHDYFWALTIAHHPVSSPDKLRLVHILPAVSEKEADYVSGNEQMAHVVTNFVTQAIVKARKIPAEKLSVSTIPVQSSFAGLIPSLETMKIIVLAKLASRALQQYATKPVSTSIEALRAIEKRLKVQTVFSERKKMIDYIIFQGRESFQQRKKTIKFMSSPKFQ